MTGAVALPVFFVGAITSLLTSWIVVSRVERIGSRMQLSPAMLGLLAALAADAPEITSAVSALLNHQQVVGSGVVIGSNVFNLGALVGLGAAVAGRLALHRHVVILTGGIAIYGAVICWAAVAGVAAPGVALALVLCVLVPYGALAARRGPRRAASHRSRVLHWLDVAVSEEDLELASATRVRRARPADVVVGVLALFVVVAASAAMERAASTVGARLGVADIVTGGIVLAGVTSLPNVVAAVYLARRRQGPAMLSEALNSNALNIAAGLLLPGAIFGMSAATASESLIAVWNIGLTVVVVWCALHFRGLQRDVGFLVMGGYVAFVVALLASTSRGANILPGLVPAVLVAAAGCTIVLRGGPLRPRAPSRAAVPEPVSADLPRGDRVTPTDWSLPEPTRWSVNRIWLLSILLCVTIAACDALLGPRAILIELLIVGPCCALLTGRWVQTAGLGLLALTLAVLLGLPDKIWATTVHLLLIAAVGIVSASATVAARLIQTARDHGPPRRRAAGSPSGPWPFRPGSRRHDVPAIFTREGRSHER